MIPSEPAIDASDLSLSYGGKRALERRSQRVLANGMAEVGMTSQAPLVHGVFGPH